MTTGHVVARLDPRPEPQETPTLGPPAAALPALPTVIRSGGGGVRAPSLPNDPRAGGEGRTTAAAHRLRTGQRDTAGQATDGVAEAQERGPRIYQAYSPNRPGQAARALSLRKAHQR